MRIHGCDQCFPALIGIHHHGFAMIGFKVKQIKITTQGNFFCSKWIRQPACFRIIANALATDIPEAGPAWIGSPQWRQIGFNDINTVLT
ncbi:MAG: hypothetical protein ACD_6C00634G0001 [uncultured bacterium]|nr:MAG: hypothetical protein ACD_6C00634G0001 [uncultured bacterium]